MNTSGKSVQPYAETWLKNLRQIERCTWCGDDTERLHKDGLCSACKRREVHASTVKKATEMMPPTVTDFDRRQQMRELRIAETMVDLCKQDGEELNLILNEEIFGSINLEESLNCVAYAVCHQRDFYNDYATGLGWALSRDQCRILAYLLWKATLVNRKRRRRAMVASH